MSAPAPGARPRRRRWLRWLLLALVAALLGPPSLWTLIHWIDVAPSPAALQLAQPDPRDVPDAGNAWMHLFGIGAAPGDAPPEFARRRLEARAAMPARTLDEPVPAVRPTAADHGIDALCPVRMFSCLDWSLRHQSALDRLRGSNALRLQRFVTLLALRQWQVRTAPALDEPVADSYVASLWSQLLALDLARALERDDPAAQDAALAHAAEAVAFWRSVQQGPQELVSLMQAAVQIETLQRLAHDVFLRLPGTRRAALEPHFRAVLQPPAAAIDWSGVTRRQQAMFEAAVRDATPGLAGGLRRCFEGSSDPCLTELALSASIARQDSANHHAELLLAQQRWLEAEPGAVADAAHAFERAVEQGSVPFDDPGRLLRYFAFNPAGRILSSIALPAFPYDARLDDFEALRRLLLLAQTVERDGIPRSALPAFLEAQPPELRSPPDAAAFAHDAGWHELVHIPSDAAYWRRPRLRVALSVSPPRVAVCPQPLLIDLTGSDDPAEAAQRYVSCGNDVPAGEAFDAPDPDRPPPDLGLVELRHRREGEVLRLRAHRIAMHDGVSHHAYEGDLLLSDPEPQGWLAALGGDGDAPLYVRVRPHDGEVWISLHAPATLLPQLAQEVADGAGLQLRGVELLPASRITLHGDLPLQQVLDMIAEEGQVVLARDGREVRFSRARR